MKCIPFGKRPVSCMQEWPSRPARTIGQILPAFPPPRRTPTLERRQFAAVLALICALTLAPPVEARLICNNDEVDGWHFYCDPEPTPEEDPAEPLEAQPTPPPTPTVNKMTATEQIEAFRKHADELKHRAILDPTPANVQAYMEVNAQMAKMAGRFAAVWQRVLFETPSLDSNVRKPMTQMGTTILQDQKNAVERAALQRAAREAGFLFVYEDPQHCRICLAQAQILTAMREAHGIEILAVSSDGSAIEGFPEAVVDQGQLAALGLTDHPRPLIAIVEMSSSEVQLIGGGLLTEDQILNRVYVVREVPLGERYQ